ncbi:flagellar basal body P-ring formation protein FlgA [Vibrio sp. HDW18]|uniref:flagellar basal body P-ring formation chaperone FlgA n=1 Tax=Vibrio sp. HDW18 TaxID=2714948 RepID=UPI00140BA6A8|nr:flagellar basal body P-ring formation chaperone FlgA [Vibrio sp. HDW18]QIL84897.1 flagellar basal body P-ring formation protein FlgA [Vibrio sp. HDW18]
MLLKIGIHSHVITQCRAFYKIFYSGIGLILFFFSLAANSATIEQLLAIRQAAENHVLNTIDMPSNGELVVNAANLDDRLFATDCAEPLATHASSSKGSAANITVLVECKSDNWRIYVPVRLTMTIPLVIAATPLTRGQMIAASDVTVSMVDLLRFRRQGFSNPENVIGAKIKKNIRLGDVIEQNDVCIVCRNESVVIRAGKSGMSITTKGTALADGVVGEQIKVKNDKSNRIIDAQVSAVGEVSVVF